MTLIYKLQVQNCDGCRLIALFIQAMCVCVGGLGGGGGMLFTLAASVVQIEYYATIVIWLPFMYACMGYMCFVVASC